MVFDFLLVVYIVSISLMIQRCRDVDTYLAYVTSLSQYIVCTANALKLPMCSHTNFRLDLTSYNVAQ